jgi:hypothetical protein
MLQRRAGRRDALRCPSARKRGLKTICWYEDVFRGDVPNIEKLQEKDLCGRLLKSGITTIRARPVDRPHQERWGDRYALTGDQNTKGRFENDRSGYPM